MVLGALAVAVFATSYLAASRDCTDEPFGWAPAVIACAFLASIGVSIVLVYLLRLRNRVLMLLAYIAAPIAAFIGMVSVAIVGITYSGCYS